jgi:hypothetical protein
MNLAANTYDECRQFEDTNPARHEYIGGFILGVDGGTPAHASLQGVLFALERRLENHTCQAFPSLSTDRLNLAIGVVGALCDQRDGM